MSAACIFSFLCLKSLKFLTCQSEYKKGYLCRCILFFFLISNSIININGFRFWTAMWYVVWCTFNLVLSNKKVFLLLLPFSLFIHSSMLVYIIVFLLYYISRNQIKLWLILSVISIILSSFSILLAQSIVSYLPEILQRTIIKYTDADYMQANTSGTGWFWLEHLFDIIKLVFLFVILFFVSRVNRIEKLSTAQRELFVFTLCLFSFSNFTTAIPSLGSRFINITYPFIAYFLVIFSKDGQMVKLTRLIPFVFSFTAVYEFTKMYILLLPSNFFYSSLLSIFL